MVCAALIGLVTACPLFAGDSQAQTAGKPSLELEGTRHQRLPRIRVTARSEPGLTVTVKTRLKAAQRNFSLPDVVRTVPAKGGVALTVKVDDSALRASRAALRRGARVIAHLKVIAGGSGDTRVRRIAVHLR